jgi:O-antigen/teichoic acid export membrane protein
MPDAARRSGLRANLAVGALSTAWSAIVAIVSIHWFVKLLGIESYGLIGFFATLQAAVGILDLGLGATVNREVAKADALGDLARVCRLIHSLEALYAAVALLIAAVVFLTAPLIAAHWLSANTLNNAQVIWSVRLMGMTAAVRWPVGLYQGALIGLHRARISYKITAAITTIGNVGAIFLLYAVYTSLWSYFVWQAFVALINLAWMRRSAWHELGFHATDRRDWTLLKMLLVESATLSSVAISGLLLSQLDKLIVSGSASLADFGRYSLAGFMASALVVILIPTLNVIYPRMSALVAAGSSDDLVGFYRVGTRILACVLIPLSASAFFYAGDLLQLWTGSVALAQSTAPIARLLILGSTLNGIMHFPYAAQLATGNERLTLSINVGLIAVMLPTMVILARSYGAMGGAIGWAVQNGAYFTVGIALTHRRILQVEAARWFFGDLLPPLIMAALMVAGGHVLVVSSTGNPLMRLVLASVIATAAMILAAGARADTRRILSQLGRRRFAP